MWSYNMNDQSRQKLSSENKFGQLQSFLSGSDTPV